MLWMSFPRKDLHGNGVRGILPKRDYSRRHLRIHTVSFPSLNSLKKKKKKVSILRCDVEGSQGINDLAVHNTANPKHPEGMR